ncbi:MAG: LPS export ABC transporter periplasmic protein LptC [Dongiaceae bacterium]
MAELSDLRDVPASPRPAAAAARWQPPRARSQPRRRRTAYSRVVLVLRLLLPALAVAMIVVITMWHQFTQEENRFRLGGAEMAPHQVASLTMANVRYEGVDEKNRPFNVTADTARQVDKQGEVIDLAEPKADITMESGEWLALTAASGRYQRRANSLDLAGGVTIFHDKGFTFQAATLHVNLTDRTADSREAVQGQGPSGELTATSFRMIEGGNVLLFGGPAHITLYGDAVGTAAEALDKASAPAAAPAAGSRRND